MEKVTQLFLHLFFLLNIQKHHIHVNIQNMKKMWHIFDREKNYGALNRGTLIRFLMKNTLKCKKNKTFF
jgi:TRAP-type mannitol/chloroaromatic compound transport system permease small subunit